MTGASKYVVYKFSNGSFGYIGSTTDLLIDDENITADTADGPQIGRNPFSGPGNYPRAVTFIHLHSRTIRNLTAKDFLGQRVLQMLLYGAL